MKKFFAIPRDLWACHGWLGVGELWLLWACGGTDVWKVEEAQLEKGSEKNFTKSILLRGRHFFWMTNVWSSQFYKKGVLTPGLLSFCHVGNLSWGKRPSGKNAVVSQSLGSLPLPLLPSLWTAVFRWQILENCLRR